MHKLVGCSLLSAMVATAGVAGAAPDSGQTVTVAIEIGEAKAKSVSLVLTLSGEHGCASAEDTRPGVDHRAQICREGGTQTAPILAFDIERSRNNGEQAERQHFKLRARVGTGAPKVLGQVGRGEDRFEIKAGLLE